MSQKDFKDKERFFLEIYDKYLDKIFRFVFLKTNHKETAQDITSEVFFKAWKYIKTGKEIRHPSGFLYRTAKNLVANFYSKKRFENVLPLEGKETKLIFRAEEKIFLEDELYKVVQALKKINPEYQDLIILRYIEELEIKEIAQILNKSESAVRMQLSRALKALRGVIE